VQSARTLRSRVGKVYAVVRPGADATARALAGEGCEVVVCAKAGEGMGASLACGASAAGEVGGYVIALADMPFVRTTSIAAVREALEAGASFAVPYYHGRRGHPVAIAGRYRHQLEKAHGDEGARQLLAANANLVVKVPVGDPGVIRDIDQPSDLAPPVL
jgi:molybdenum cofactor cytidylyltransferase